MAACAPAAAQLVSTASYQLPPTEALHHALWWRCHAGPSAVAEDHQPSRGALRFVVFKVARAGSTWLTEALDRALS
eukprot:1577920-Prymnesium_polylepis.1